MSLSSQGGSSGDNLPIGTILPYNGPLADIPAGWALCDGTNGTPNLNGRFLEGSTSKPNTFIAAGLPNIFGGYTAHKTAENAMSSERGAIYFTYSGWNISGHTHGADGPELTTLNFDASRCSSVYGRSNTVQPSSYTVYYIIKIK